MELGKKVRLNRLFANPSGRLCSLAIDHGLGYWSGFPQGLVEIEKTLAKTMPGQPDAVTLMKGAAMHLWGPYAGTCPLIVSSIAFTPDDRLITRIAKPEEALRLGADAIAVAIGVRGSNESTFLKFLAEAVETASPLGLPVVAHIYPRDFSQTPRIVHDPDNVFFAMRCGLECGADVIKVPYTGDPKTYRDIVAACPVPLVAAGGPQCDTLRDSLVQMEGVVASSARGATIGRNIWGRPEPASALRAFKAVIHDGVSADEALKRNP